MLPWNQESTYFFIGVNYRQILMDPDQYLARYVKFYEQLRMTEPSNGQLALACLQRAAVDPPTENFSLSSREKRTCEQLSKAEPSSGQLAPAYLQSGC